ncbi:MAG: phosphoribosylformylglycinamidine synthase subunit PurQ [Thaumarchaeota archaeon]|nr:MAG: phosphoribosylformylglycinamidine synthase subunit PurQ [Nitrososphaerota archaeon]
MTRVLVLRAPGTNCDKETARALREAGAIAEIIHVNRVVEGAVDLFGYDGLVIPGGFSYGDRVRAGAILSAKIRSKIWEKVKAFADEGRPVLGICNGFQVLVELGLLPGSSYGEHPAVALAPNLSARFEARWVYLRHVNKGKCIFTRSLGEKVLRMPVAHAEGRFMTRNDEVLRRIMENDQAVFIYAKPDGSPADGEYPYNPNGSALDVAGICDEDGNVMGLMPHPERAIYAWQLPEKAREDGYADGMHVFEEMVRYIEEKIK